MGADLGSRVSSMLEAQGWVGELLGIDADPPRRRLSKARFHLVAPGDRERIGELISDFDPHVYLHLAVWEPSSRAAPKHARELTEQAAQTFLGIAAEGRSLESIVVRSGIEVYGRGRNSPTRPDEDSVIAPTCEFGRTLADLEATATAVGARIGVPVGAVRLGPVLGPHVPSPLGRLLRQPVVPFSLLADAPFTVVEDSDSAQAIVAAAARRLAEPVNVVANGAITAFQAARRGGRIPLPLVGPEWVVARLASELAGAPIPEQVMEIMHRGRLASNARMSDLLGFTVATSTVEVVDRVYAWPSVVHQPARRQVA